MRGSPPALGQACTNCAAFGCQSISYASASLLAADLAGYATGQLARRLVATVGTCRGPYGPTENRIIQASAARTPESWITRCVRERKYVYERGTARRSKV